jgi:hypothetical protein
MGRAARNPSQRARAMGFAQRLRKNWDEGAARRSCVLVAVGMRITAHPPHRTGRAQFGHPAPASGG